MDITISNQDELKDAISKLNDSDNVGLTVRLTFPQDKMLTKETISALSATTCIKANDCRIDLTTSHQSLTTLPDKQKMAIMSSPTFATKLYDPEFIELCGAEKTAEMVLQSPDLSTRLNAVDLRLQQQTFPNSCAARSIMNALHALGKLDEKEITRAKELEIYQKIWIKPYSISDPKKIIKFLTEHGVNVINVELEEKQHVKTTLENTPQMKKLYKLFKGSSGSKKMNLDNVENCQEHSTLLLVTMVDDNPHVILGRKEKGKFIMTDTLTGKIDNYDKFSDFIKKVTFTGVFFELNINEFKATQQQIINTALLVASATQRAVTLAGKSPETSETKTTATTPTSTSNDSTQGEVKRSIKKPGE